MLPDKPIKVLVIGNGGREHALCWKLAHSPQVEKIYCAPGNGGTATEAKTENVSIGVFDFPAISHFCREQSVDFVVVGPDNPLADGIVDYLRNDKIRTFGPTQAQARMESSKAFAKDFMTSVNLPTAKYKVCTSFAEAEDAVTKNEWARVVKVDGLALGKGVFVCDTRDEAVDALRSIFKSKTFGAAGEKVIIEEKLQGEELSLLMLVDGRNLLVLEPCQDHKRRYEHDEGPNTGGMGAYSPVTLYDRQREEISRQIIEPLKAALQNGKLDFSGVLYAGIMVGRAHGDKDTKPYLLEFNARFGDPETQALMPRLRSDLLPALWACTTGQLDEIELRWNSKSCCCVVAVGKDYPASSSKDKEIKLSPLPAGSVLFHAGTKSEAGKIVTNGGRVLAICGLGEGIEAATAASYEAIKSVAFEDMEFRKDIAGRELKQCLSK